MGLKAKVVTSTNTTVGTADPLFSSAKRVRRAIIAAEHDNANAVHLAIKDDGGSYVHAFTLANPAGAAANIPSQVELPGPNLPGDEPIDLSEVKLFVVAGGEGVRVLYYEITDIGKGS